MDTKEVIVWLVVLAALIALPNMMREVPLGADSYYYIHYANQPQPGFPPLFFFLSNINNIALTYCAAFLSLSLLYCIATQLNSREPLWAAALLLAAPGVIFKLSEIEDDVLGIVCVLACLAFYISADKNDESFISKVAPILSLFLVALIAWKAAVLFLGFVALYEIAKRFKYWPILLLVVPFFIRPDSLVSEDAMGLLYAPIVLLGTIAGFKGWNKTTLFTRVWALSFLVLGICQAKFLWLAAFPLAIMLMDALRDEPEKKVAKVVSLFIVLGLAFGGFMVLKGAPSAELISDMKDIKAITGDKLVANSWHFGHWMRYAGLNPLNDNLHPGAAVNESNWTQAYALHHNSSYPLPEHYHLLHNYSWGALYEKEKVVCLESPIFSNATYPCRD